MTTVIAHRGAWAETGLAEQTRASFTAAFAVGADGVECDVRLTADDEVVCHHDATVERSSNGAGAVHELTLAQLRALDWQTDQGDGIVTLAELVDIASAAGRPVLLAVELKHPNASGTRIDEHVLEVLASKGWNPRTATIGAVTVDLMTFNPESVPVLARGVDLSAVTMLTAAATLDDVAYAFEGPVDAAARDDLQRQLREALTAGRALIDDGVIGGAGPDIDLVRREPDTVRRWIAAGRRVRVWTVDDEADLQRCLDLGVTEIETDLPQQLLRTLGR